MNNSSDSMRVISRIMYILVYIIRKVRPDMEYDLFILHVGTHEQAFVAKNILNTWVDRMKINHL